MIIKTTLSTFEQTTEPYAASTQSDSTTTGVDTGKNTTSNEQTSIDFETSASSYDSSITSTTSTFEQTYTTSGPITGTSTKPETLNTKVLISRMATSKPTTTIASFYL